MYWTPLASACTEEGSHEISSHCHVSCVRSVVHCSGTRSFDSVQRPEDHPGRRSELVANVYYFTGLLYRDATRNQSGDQQSLCAVRIVLGYDRECGHFTEL